MTNGETVISIIFAFLICFQAISYIGVALYRCYCVFNLQEEVKKLRAMPITSWLGAPLIIALCLFGSVVLVLIASLPVFGWGLVCILFDETSDTSFKAKAKQNIPANNAFLLSLLTPVFATIPFLIGFSALWFFF